MQPRENTLSEHFKCPAHLVPFASVETPSTEPGYFLFGPNAVCFGQLTTVSPSKRADASLPDLFGYVTANGKGLVLPFDLDAVVRNLRAERYLESANHQKRGLTGNPLVKSIYYNLMRPLMGVAVRKHLQRVHLRGWDKIPFPKWPVDFSVETLLERVMALSLKHSSEKRIPFIWFWPNGASSCAIMTHDVEAPPGRDFCSALMDMDESVGIKSSFQIVPELRYEVPESFLESIRSRGFEVNVHDFNHDGQLFRDKAEFERRAAKINQYAKQFGAKGFRAGTMYRNQEWFSSFDFSYDMSVPDVAHLEPQRGGCCTVMPYFIGNIVELPLTITQDYSLFNIIQHYSMDLWEKQTSAILQRNGLMSFIAHPDYLIESRARRVYQALLVHLAKLRDQQNVWIPLPREVDRWWRNRNQMTLIRDGNGWRIEGPEKERARVAYAALDGDRLVYSLEESQ